LDVALVDLVAAELYDAVSVWPVMPALIPARNVVENAKQREWVSLKEQLRANRTRALAAAFRRGERDAESMTPQERVDVQEWLVQDWQHHA
jgi:hypothetical protein